MASGSGLIRMAHAGGLSEYLKYDGLGLADLVLHTEKLSYEVMSKRLLDFIPFTWLHNVTGLPAMSVPLHRNAQGLPVGVKFAGRYADEATLYRLAGQPEKARPWREKIPSMAL